MARGAAHPPLERTSPVSSGRKSAQADLGDLGDAKTCFVKQSPRLRLVSAFPNISFGHTVSAAWKHARYPSLCRLLGRTISSQPDECIFRSKAQGLTSPPMTMPDAVLISAQARSNGFSHRRLSDQGTPHLETCSTLHLPLLYSKLFCIQLNYNLIQEKGPTTIQGPNPTLKTHIHPYTGIVFGDCSLKNSLSLERENPD